MRQTSVNSLTKAKKKSLIGSLTELSEGMLTLLVIDHPCAQRQIAEARRVVEVRFISMSIQIKSLLTAIFIQQILQFGSNSYILRHFSSILNLIL